MTWESAHSLQEVRGRDCPTCYQVVAVRGRFSEQLKGAAVPNHDWKGNAPGRVTGMPVVVVGDN